MGRKDRNPFKKENMIMTSLGWLRWPFAAMCLILMSSSTVAAASTTSLQAAAPRCPTPQSPYGISYACAQLASAEALRRAPAGAASDPPPVPSDTRVCPTPRVPYDLSYACAQAASAAAIAGVAGPAVNNPPAAETGAPACAARSQWDRYACAHAPTETEVGPALAPGVSPADFGTVPLLVGD